MNYKFPHITHIDDVLPHVEGRKEFVVAERDGFTVINYVVQTPDTFADDEDGWDIRRECRGLTFDKDGYVAARKFHKFFNVNERDETQLHNIDLDKPHVILEKLDGSMITPFLRDGDIEWHTKMGATDVAGPVNDFVAENQNYRAFAMAAIEHGVTPIFEWCSRKNRIVIDYAEDNLVLLAMRDNATGEYWDYKRMCDAALGFVPVVKVHDSKLDADFMDYVRGLVGVEGFVVRFDDGHMVKVKAEDYLKLHKAKEAIAQEKNVWALILDENVDDLKSFLQEEDRKRVEAFEVDLWKEVNEKIDLVEAFVADAKSFLDDGNLSMFGHLTRPDFEMFEDADRDKKKMFATEMVRELPFGLHSVAFKAYDGMNVRDLVINFIQNNLGTGTKLDKIRPLFNNIRFEEVEYEE